MDFADSQTAIAVGGFGTITRSENGGSTWSISDESATGSFLYGVDFADPLTAIAVGEGGTILRSEDGGKTWNKISSGTDMRLWSVRFADSQTAIAVGEGGTIFRSEDGGKVWRRVTTATEIFLRSVDFADPQNAIAVGESGTILRSEDGGKSWSSFASTTGNNLKRVDFVDLQTAFAVGEGGEILTSRVYALAQVGAPAPQLMQQLRSGDLVADLKKHPIAEAFARRGFFVSLEASQNTILSNEETTKKRDADIIAFRESAPKDSGTGLEGLVGQTTVIRVAILALLAFLLQLLVNLYRYNMRLAAYYSARADALVLSFSERHDLWRLIDAFSPDSLDFGRAPKSPTQQIADVVRAARGGPATTPR